MRFQFSYPAPDYSFGSMYSWKISGVNEGISVLMVVTVVPVLELS